MSNFGVAAGGERDLNIMSVWNTQKNFLSKTRKQKEIKASNKNPLPMKVNTTHQEAQRLIQKSSLATSKGPVISSRAKFHTSLKGKPVQKVLVPKQSIDLTTPVSQFEPIDESMLQSFQQFTLIPNTTAQIKDQRESERKSNLEFQRMSNTEQKKIDSSRYMRTGFFMKQRRGNAVPAISKDTRRTKSRRIVNTEPGARDASADQDGTDCNEDLICKFHQQGICKLGKKCPLRHVDMYYSPMDEIENVSLSDSSQSESIIGSSGNSLSKDEAESTVDKKLKMPESIDGTMVKDKTENTTNDELNKCFVLDSLRDESTKTMSKFKVDSKMENKNSGVTSDAVMKKFSVDPIDDVDEMKDNLVKEFIIEARYCQSKKDYEGAVKNARAALKLSSHDVEVVKLVQILGHGLMMTGNLKESLKVATALVQFIDKVSGSCEAVNEKLRTDAIYLRATIMVRLENIEEAIDMLETLLDDQPHCSKAKKQLYKLKQIVDNNKVLEAYCSEAEQVLNDPRKALEILNRAMTIPTTSRDGASRILNLLGHVTMSLGMFETAETYLTSLLNLEKWEGEWELEAEKRRIILMERGKCRLAMGHRELAFRDFQKAEEGFKHT